MSPITKWANDERAMQRKWRKDDQDLHENLRAIDTIELLMQGLLSPTEAAQEIAGTFEPRLASKQRQSIGSLWGIISEATRCSGHIVAQRLAELMTAITQLPDIVDVGGHPVKHGGAVLWRELPSWGWIFYEHGLGI